MIKPIVVIKRLSGYSDRDAELVFIKDNISQTVGVTHDEANQLFTELKKYLDEVIDVEVYVSADRISGYLAKGYILTGEVKKEAISNDFIKNFNVNKHRMVKYK